MTMKQKIATVFGGTGFLGRYVVRELARAGYIVKVATRVPERAYFLKPAGAVGQVVSVHCQYKDPVSIAATVRGSDVVVNCIGILYERRRGDFRRVHQDLPSMIAQACASSAVDRFVHVSSLGVAQSKSRYAKTKLAGEDAVLKTFPRATILRPSVLFGPEDEFFNMFAAMAKFLPVLPLIGGGKTKFQPVYVADVASAVMAALSSGKTQGRVYELGGPETLSMKDIYKHLFAWTGRSRLLLNTPFCLASVQAFFIQCLPPRPLLTPDQVTSLKTDSIVAGDASGFDDLGIQPTGMDLIVPAYLERFRSGGRFSTTRTA